MLNSTKKRTDDGPQPSVKVTHILCSSECSGIDEPEEAVCLLGVQTGAVLPHVLHDVPQTMQMLGARQQLFYGDGHASVRISDDHLERGM